MARRKAARDQLRAPKKDPKDAARQGSAASGGGMFRLLFYLAILGGVGYAAMRVPIGGKTAFAHLAEVLKSDVLSKKAGDVGRAAKEAAKDAVARAVDRKDPARDVARAPEKTPAKVADRAAAKSPEKRPAVVKAPAKAPPAPTRVADAGRARPPPERLSQAERDALDKLVR